MTTSYVFTHKREQNAHRVLHVGKHLVTATNNWEHVVQEFENDAAAKAHVDRYIALRKRTGYAVREIELAPDTIILPPELSGDPLFEFVSWVDGPPRRLAVLLNDTVSPQTLTAIVDRIDKEKPPMIKVGFSSTAAPNVHFVQEFIGRSLPTIRNLILSQVMDLPLDQHDLQYGGLAHVVAAMPELQRAFLNGDVGFCPFQHAALVELHVHGDPICIATVEALGECSMPALRTLGIMLCEEMRSECRDEMVAIALSTLNAPCLEWLRVQGVQDIAYFLEELSRRGLPSCLHTLRLEGEIPDEDALLDVLARHTNVLRRLGNVSLPLLDEVSSCAVARAREILPDYVDQSNVWNWDSDEVYGAW